MQKKSVQTYNEVNDVLFEQQCHTLEDVSPLIILARIFSRVVMFLGGFKKLFSIPDGL